MTFPNTNDLLNNSVTAGDTIPHSGSPAPVFYLTSYAYGLGYQSALPADLPPYYSVSGDAILSSTMYAETFWASAVSIAGTKIASKSFEYDGESAERVQRAKDIMMALDGNGYVSGILKGVNDFLNTDNGEWWEIVRVSNARGARIIGLMHLDSLRCQRTGDPAIPMIYRDLKGNWHEMKDYQVINLVDMPSPRAEHFGVGLCAAHRAYSHIYKMAALEKYVNEKITGNSPLEIHVINGITEKSLRNAITTADAQQAQRGGVSYKGVTVIPLMGDTPIAGYRIQLAGLPENFARREELDIALLGYADSIGIDLQELSPLSGQGFGTGAQSYVLNEKAKGKGIAAREKQFTHEINLKVNPSEVTFYLSEIDYTDQKASAEAMKARADVRSTMKANGEITAEEARNLAVDAGDLPDDFLITDLTDDVSTTDTDNQEVEEGGEGKQGAPESEDEQETPEAETMGEDDESEDEQGAGAGEKSLRVKALKELAEAIRHASPK